MEFNNANDKPTFGAAILTVICAYFSTMTLDLYSNWATAVGLTLSILYYIKRLFFPTTSLSAIFKKRKK